MRRNEYLAIHTFSSTGEAYDACQCYEDIQTGDILLIPGEKIVGIADAWPFAVTKNHGHFHKIAPGHTDEDFLKSANEFKKEHGYKLLNQGHLDIARAIARFYWPENID